jgi:hypothetical protein
MIFRRSGVLGAAERGQQGLRQVAGLVAELRKPLTPASADTAATASTNTRLNRRPRFRRGSGTCASTPSRPGITLSVLVTAL